MEKIIEKEGLEFKSAWANGEYVPGSVRSVGLPSGENPYWKIELKSGDTLYVTGQVIVKRGPKI